MTISESITVNSMLNDTRSGGDLAIIIDLNTRLRVGEICAPRWKDIDLTRKMIKVSSTVHRVKCKEGKTKTKLVLQKPKTDTSEREVPISDFLYKILSKI